jgi:hypothetical protein
LKHSSIIVALFLRLRKKKGGNNPHFRFIDLLYCLQDLQRVLRNLFLLSQQVL